MRRVDTSALRVAERAGETAGVGDGVVVSPRRNALQERVARIQTTSNRRNQGQERVALVHDPGHGVADGAPARVEQRAERCFFVGGVEEELGFSQSSDRVQNRGIRSDLRFQQRSARGNRSSIGAERAAVQHVEQKPGRREPAIVTVIVGHAGRMHTAHRAGSAT